MWKKAFFITIPVCLFILGMIVQPVHVRAEGGTETPTPSITSTPTATPIPCAKGDGFVTAQVFDKARDAYIEEMGTPSDVPCAIDGLKSLPKTSDIIQKNIELGDYDSAWNDLQSGIKVNPQDKDLQALTKKPWAFAYRAKAFFTSFVVLVVLVLVSLIVAVFVRFRRKPKLDIDKFDASVVGKDKADSFATEIRFRFEDEITNQGQLRSIKNPDVVDGPLTALTLPDIGLPDPVNKYLGVILGLFQSPVVSVDGFLTKDKSKGFGIITRLVHGGNKRLLNVNSVWESEVIPNFNLDDTEAPEDDERYRVLTKYAAIRAHWDYYQKVDPKGLRRAYGTTNYESHIQTRLATGMQEKDPNNEMTIPKLRQALVEDENNVVAMLNLSKFILREDPEESNRLLDKVKTSTRLHKNSMMLPHIYANYRWGANILEKYPPAMAGSVELKDALDCLEEAHNDAQTYIKKNPEITEELVNMIAVPYADALRKMGDNRKSTEMIKEVEHGASTSPKVLYNLACYYSNDSATYGQALKHLKNAMRLQPEYFTDAEKDPSLNALRNDPAYEVEIRQQFGESHITAAGG